MGAGFVGFMFPMLPPCLSWHRVELPDFHFTHMPRGAPRQHHGRGAWRPGVAMLEHSGGAFADLLSQEAEQWHRQLRTIETAAPVGHLGPTCTLFCSHLVWYLHRAAHGSSVVLTVTILQVRGNARDRDRTKQFKGTWGWSVGGASWTRFPSGCLTEGA